MTACLGNSVCGFLQANSKGVSKVPYCNCSHADCPMNWDPYDGKSLTQSTSDQYKVKRSNKMCQRWPKNRWPKNVIHAPFAYSARSCLAENNRSKNKSISNFFSSFQFCESAPTNLQICNVEDPSNPSYTSFQYYDRSTRYKEMLKDEIFCLCPEGYNYLDTRYVFYQWGSYDVVQINSYCLPVS